MEILIYHPRQTGDVIIGAHCAKLVKQKHPDSTLIFVTGDHLVDLIEPCPWIDITLPSPDFKVEEMMREEDRGKRFTASDWFDLCNLRTFEKLAEDWEPDLAFRPHWSPEPPHSIHYSPPYMFRCYAACCDLTPEESDDTTYSLPVSDEEKKSAQERWKAHQGKSSGSRVLLHMDLLASSFESLVKTHGALLLDTSGKISLRENLALMSQADVVVTRYGGVAVMAASVGTRTITIPKPEPTAWASPVYSHPGQGHVILLPTHRCSGYEGSTKHRLQPCQPDYGSYSETDCPLGRKHTSDTLVDSFHCWRDVSVGDVCGMLDAISLEKYNG